MPSHLAFLSPPPKTIIPDLPPPAPGACGTFCLLGLAVSPSGQALSSISPVYLRRLFIFTCALQCGGMLYHNGIFRYGQMTQVGGMIQMSIRLSRPLKIHAGQHIDLWIPSVSFWSFLQSHPFMVSLWADGKQKSLHRISSRPDTRTSRPQQCCGVSLGSFRGATWHQCTCGRV